MRTETQSNAERAQLASLIAPLTLAMLTRRDADNTLVSWPAAPLELDGNGALWFFFDLNLMAAEHIDAVNLSLSDPARGIHVSISGRGDLHVDRARIERLWTPFARHWFPRGPDAPGLVLLKVVPGRAEVWDAAQGRMVRALGIADVAAMSRRIAIGKQDSFAAWSRPLWAATPG